MVAYEGRKQAKACKYQLGSICERLGFGTPRVDSGSSEQVNVMVCKAGLSSTIIVLFSITIEMIDEWRNFNLWNRHGCGHRVDEFHEVGSVGE